MLYFYMGSFLLWYMELCNTWCYGVCKCAVEITFMERYFVDPNCESTASAEFSLFHCMSVCIERSKASANTAPGKRT